MRPPPVRVQLFGALRLCVGDAPATPIESARARSLLAYLVLHRDAPQARQRIAFLLWPDSSEPQARTNLRHVLHDLRLALPDVDRLLDVRHGTLRWRADVPCRIDVVEFTDALARATSDAPDGGAAALREAVDAYAGDLLESCDDEWVLGPRERLRQQYVAALERLATLLAERGEHAAAIGHAERLLRAEPLREETYRLLMRLHDARGDRARALRVYHVCAATLERELGVAPTPATRAIYEALLPAGDAAAPTAAGAAPLVGRPGEWARLVDAWRAADAGRAHLVVVTGDPGIGKTRLVEELRAWCAHRGAVTASARSYAAEGALAYAPVVAWLRAGEVRARLDGLAPALRAELARLLPELRGPGADDRPSAGEPDADGRQRLFDAAARALLGPGHGDWPPLLLVADDLQWCDRETLRFLHYLLRAAPGARLLVAATVRDEELDRGHPAVELLDALRARERVTEIALRPLSRDATAALAEHAARPLAPADLDRLFGATEGNPLFVVEALGAGWRGGTPAAPPVGPRGQAAIEARLAQLSPAARDLVDVAATVGRAFTAGVLACAAGADDDALVRALDELWRRRIVREQGGTGGADAYDFSHDRIREVAYQALGPARRRHLHRRVALALERAHAGDPAPVSGQLAAHHERAGDAETAAAWYERAADAAQRVYADADAVRLFDRALALLAALPATPARRTRELALLTALAAPLGAVEGYGSARIADVQRRAITLAGTLGVEPAAPLLRSLALHSLAAGELDAAREIGERLRVGAERDADAVALVEGSYVLGISAFWRGELDAARAHFEAAVAGYRPEHRHTHLLRYGLDPKVVCLSRLANTLALLGRPAAAERARVAAFALGDEIGHPGTRSVALVFAALLALDLRDGDGLRDAAAGLAAVPGVRDAPQTKVAAEAFDGYLDVLDGRTGGVARIRRARDEARAAAPAPGASAMVGHVLLCACVAAREARTGLAEADALLAAGAEARLWEADTRRIRAELLDRLGAPAADVDAELARAVDVARRQGARALELRAVASLLRLRLRRADSARAGEARALLASLLAALPEMRDGRDGRDAAALLARA